MCSKVNPSETLARAHTHTHTDSVACCAAPQLAAWNQEPLQGDGGVARPREHRHLRHTLQGARKQRRTVNPHSTQYSEC